MEILFRGTCRFLVFIFIVSFLTFFLEGSFLFRVCTKIKNNIKCLRIPVFFHFITLAKVFFHLLASLPFFYTLELGTCIGMLLNRNVIKSNNIFFFNKTHLRAQILSVPWNICARDPCNMCSSCSI